MAETAAAGVRFGALKLDWVRRQDFETWSAWAVLQRHRRIRIAQGKDERRSLD